MIYPKKMKLFSFLLAFALSAIVYGQSSCDTANSYFVIAYAHVKDAYSSNNISHLKYFAKRSQESFNLSKKSLKDCGCDKALKLANESIDFLVKAQKEKTYEDSRFFIKRSRELSKKSMSEIDLCSMEEYEDELSKKPKLSNLELEQELLRHQQKELQLKADLLKAKMEKQKAESLALKRKVLISSYKKTISENVTTYNASLKACNCDYSEIKAKDDSSDLSTNNLEDIKSYYKNNLKALASNYIEQLDSCN